MSNNRRQFIKQIGLAGFGIVSAGKVMEERAADSARTLFQKNSRQEFNMHGYAAPALDVVRVGLIGIGSRGSGTVERLARIEGVEIRALCDVVPHRVTDAIESIEEYPHQPDAYTGGEEDWKRLCERDDIDLIYIATPWHLHAEMAICAMKHDKHVYTELPVGNTLEECWDVVETSEKTRKHCLMGSSSCHDGMHAVLLQMAREGFFGDLIHAEGHYIHDRVSNTEARWVRDEENNNWFGFRPWRLRENVNRNGNLYPEHGLGPAAQMLDLNYGDRMDYMVSVSGDDFTMAGKMKELAEMDSFYEPYVGLTFRGNMNTTIIRTKKGRTIMLQHDISSPRPGRRFHLLSGNKGIYVDRPSRIATGHDGWLPEEEFNGLVEEYTPEITRTFEEKVRQAGGQQGGRSYSRVNATDWRLIDCLRNGLPVEMDVYDAALWSSIRPLSEWSVAREGTPIKIPDFTCGAWETNERGMNVDLKNGGGSTGLI